MRLVWMVAALALGLMAEMKPADLVIHLISESPASTYPAKKLAGSMFAAAGVRVTWRNGEPGAPEPGMAALTVRLVRGHRLCYVPDALACAYPYDASRASVVFLEPLQQDARATGTPEHILLAHVLVHEITHVLEGVDRHAKTGVMKARYTMADKYSMRSGPLPFEPQDVRMIRAGLASPRLRAGASTAGTGGLQ